MSGLYCKELILQLWEKEKLLFTSNFSFSHSVLKTQKLSVVDASK